MRHWVPMLVLGSTLGPKQALTDTFGGLPWGLPRERWPSCRECGKPMSLVAELCHAAGRLDLGAEGRVLFLFQCESNGGQCSTWKPDSGANVGFVLESNQLSPGLTPNPRDDVHIVKEARVVGWRDADDEVDETTFPKFFDDDAYFDLPEELVESIRGDTKLGSVPAWIQGAGEGPRGGGWRYALQIDETYALEGGKKANGANFGSGCAYVFLDTTGAAPEVKWLWQR